MARQRSQPDKAKRGGLVSRETMRRIGRVVQAYEHGDRDRRGLPLPRAYDGGDGGDPIRIGKVAGFWPKNTVATITLYESGTPLFEEQSSPPEAIQDCVNKFSDVEADSWVALARAANGSYYLIAAECK